MRINKTDFEAVMANSEFLDYYCQLFERNEFQSRLFMRTIRKAGVLKLLVEKGPMFAH